MKNDTQTSRCWMVGFFVVLCCVVVFPCRHGKGASEGKKFLMEKTQVLLVQRVV